MSLVLNNFCRLPSSHIKKMAQESRGICSKLVFPWPQPLTAGCRQLKKAKTSGNQPVDPVAELSAILSKPVHRFPSVPKQRPVLLARHRANPVRPKLNPIVFDEKFIELNASFATCASQSEDCLQPV